MSAGCVSDEHRRWVERAAFNRRRSPLGSERRMLVAFCSALNDDGRPESSGATYFAVDYHVIREGGEHHGDGGVLPAEILFIPRQGTFLACRF